MDPSPPLLRGDGAIASRLECTICGNGHLGYMVREGTGSVFLECIECMSAFMRISGEEISEARWVNDADWEFRPATLPEIRGAGLEHSVSRAV